LICKYKKTVTSFSVQTSKGCENIQQGLEKRQNYLKYGREKKKMLCTEKLKTFNTLNLPRRRKNCRRVSIGGIPDTKIPYIF